MLAVSTISDYDGINTQPVLQKNYVYIDSTGYTSGVLKEDPELKGLSEKIAMAKMQVLERGLSATYVRKCHEAYSKSLISQSRLAEILLTSEHELPVILALFNLKLVYEF